MPYDIFSRRKKTVLECIGRFHSLSMKFLLLELNVPMSVIALGSANPDTKHQ